MSAAPLLVGLGGSTGPSSLTGRLLHDCLKRGEDRGARTIAFDGPQLAELSIFSPHGGEVNDVAVALVEAVRQADAVVIATPGYHGGMSGLVKNAIDHLEWLHEDSRPYLDGRAVGVIVSAAGWQACGTTLVSVRSAIHALRGWPTPFGVTVNSAEQGPEDATVAGSLEILAGQLVDFTSWQAAARASAR
ncbi:MAG: NADPH-dependent FMN reductase [Jatrophihabitantaceae bacterium]